MNARTLDPAHHLIKQEPYYEPVGDEIQLFEAAYRQQHSQPAETDALGARVDILQGGLIVCDRPHHGDQIDAYLHEVKRPESIPEAPDQQRGEAGESQFGEALDALCPGRPAKEHHRSDRRPEHEEEGQRVQQVAPPEAAGRPVFYACSTRPPWATPTFAAIASI